MGEEGRGGVRAHTALLLGASPWRWGTLGSRTLVAFLAQGWRWEALLEPGSQLLSVCGAWVVWAHRDLGRPHFFSLPSESRQGLLCPQWRLEDRGADHSSDP